MTDLITKSLMDRDSLTDEERNEILKYLDSI